VTAVTRFVRRLVGSGFFVAVLAICVKGNLELLGFPFAFPGVMACFALLDLVAFLPHVLAAFVDMVTFIARQAVVLGMHLVAERNGTFLVGVVALVVDNEFFGRIIAGERENREKKKSCEGNKGDPILLLHTRASWMKFKALSKVFSSCFIPFGSEDVTLKTSDQ
jgi:hypothetical protein